jgi:hypothetical protein
MERAGTVEPEFAGTVEPEFAGMVEVEFADIDIEEESPLAEAFGILNRYVKVSEGVV